MVVKLDWVGAIAAPALPPSLFETGVARASTVIGLDIGVVVASFRLGPFAPVQSIAIFLVDCTFWRAHVLRAISERISLAAACCQSQLENVVVCISLCRHVCTHMVLLPSADLLPPPG